MKEWPSVEDLKEVPIIDISQIKFSYIDFMHDAHSTYNFGLNLELEKIPKGMIGESEIELKSQFKFDKEVVFSLVKMWHESGDLKGLEFRGWNTYKEFMDD